MISTYITGEELFTRGRHFEFGAERLARSKDPDGRLGRQTGKIRHKIRHK